jgi:hypothetical protein
MSLKLNAREIMRLNSAAVRTMEQTIDALQTEVRTAEVMPYDNGNMQNNDTFTETSVHDHEIESRLITGSVQVRRLYYHPEYNFQIVNNHNAGGKWLEPWINGEKKDFAQETFAELYKKEVDG